MFFPTEPVGAALLGSQFDQENVRTNQCDPEKCVVGAIGSSTIKDMKIMINHVSDVVNASKCLGQDANR